MPWIDGQFRPSRSSGIKCAECRRVFAEGSVPSPDADGRRVCRDCRWEHIERQRASSSPPAGGDAGDPEPEGSTLGRTTTEWPPCARGGIEA